MNYVRNQLQKRHESGSIPNSCLISDLRSVFYRNMVQFINPIDLSWVFLLYLLIGLRSSGSVELRSHLKHLPASIFASSSE